MEYYCEKCRKTMDEKQFYLSNNLEKYGDTQGHLHQCKKCLTMHVDNWDPETYLWILEEVDVPYVPDQWNSLLSTYGAPGRKITGVTILGRYLAKMRIKQFKDYRWKDTDFLRELANSKIEQTMKRQGYSAAEIATVIEQGTMPAPEKPPELIAEDREDGSPPEQDYFDSQLGLDDLGIELTDEDKLTLRLKWGKAYKPEEWIQLEKLYNEFLESYDIQSAGHIDTLKLICKTSLKANQLIDIGD